MCTVPGYSSTSAHICTNFRRSRTRWLSHPQACPVPGLREPRVSTACTTARSPKANLLLLEPDAAARQELVCRRAKTKIHAKCD